MKKIFSFAVIALMIAAVCLMPAAAYATDSITITTQPTSVTVRVGEMATFTVAASGATSCQWYYQKPGESVWNKVLVNGTSATYTLTTAARHNGNQYRCTVSNDFGSADSATVTLTVTSASKPAITSQPDNQKVSEGTNAIFKGVASDAVS